jgi:hypothetical protein
VFPKGVTFLDVPFNVFFKSGDVFGKELVVAKGDGLCLSSYETVLEGRLECAGRLDTKETNKREPQ